MMISFSYLPETPVRGSFVFAMLIVSLNLPGCSLKNPRTQECEKVQVGGRSGIEEAAVPRRYFVQAASPLSINGAPGDFAYEIVAALNTEENCSAYLLPPGMSLGTPDSLSQEFQDWKMHLGADVTIDEILIVNVTDVVPFRPMRLSAFIERRSADSGFSISTLHRTWNAPIDDEPLDPHPFNRKVLQRPPPLGLVQHHELSRLSPKTFQRNVATQIGSELAQLPRE
ncbi:hypothetical protein SH668x_000909 [Planctomicrobium sp. SH668]|uniref:hypothetical protein n=1 Tax=Planctomicrobium sp. SH668 TaxID=3448126 RepID=UPI003F5C19A7